MIDYYQSVMYLCIRLSAYYFIAKFEANTVVELFINAFTKLKYAVIYMNMQKPYYIIIYNICVEYE